MKKWLMAITAMPLLFAVSNAAHADFSGTYAIPNWTFSTSHGGSIDTTGAPASVSLFGGSDGGGASDQTMQITSATGGAFSFHWSFTQNDCCGAFWDPFGYSVNGAFTKLTADSPDVQSGDVLLTLAAGDVFAFDQTSLDSVSGFATTVVSEFSGPTEVPEPATLALLGLGLAGLGVIRSRKTVAN
jgi:hypothetical protein